jgi:hypothetical protein
MYEAINGFIQHARGKGLDFATIRQLLLSAGWKEKDIARAFASGNLDMAVPEPAGSGNARDSFIYLLAFAALYVVVGSVIALYYTYVDYLYPDQAVNTVNVNDVLDGVRYAIAAIVIAFPLFLVLNLVMERVVRQAPDSPKQPVARWLIYLTMFLAAAVMVGDLIVLLYYFLDGSLTTGFVLKVIVLLVIAQVILSYYYLVGITSAKGTAVALRKLLAGTGIIAVSGAIVLGFSLAGSPITARQHKMDEKRVDDLRAIQGVIQQMTTKRVNGEIQVTRLLPKTLEKVAEYQQQRQGALALNLSDPDTGVKYVYAVTGEHTYELSANFALARDNQHDLFWNHAAGKHSFKVNLVSPP